MILTHAVILKAPQDTTLFLNTSAVFTCETRGTFSGWRINGILTEDLPLPVHHDLEFSSTGTDEGTTMLKLIIPATAEYNDTKVQCLTGVYFNGSLAESGTVALKVQGIKQNIK